MKKFLKNSLIIVCLFICFLFVTITSYANNIFNDLSTNIFRLHILANSNSKEDQNLKLKVRDSILEYMKNLEKNAQTKEEVLNLCEDNKENLKNIAEKVINQNGYNYTIDIEIGNFYFPTKNYANLSLPAGYYDSLRIKIGKAEGENWWCSLFPPLCFVDISSGVMEEEDSDILKETLTKEEFSLITNDTQEMKFKFKIIELINEKFMQNSTRFASN